MKIKMTAQPVREGMIKILLENSMQEIKLRPVLVNRECVQAMLGGISRTTFWRKRRDWEQNGTPFPAPAPGTNPGKGGEQYRYCDVMRFFASQGLVESTHD